MTAAIIAQLSAHKAAPPPTDPDTRSPAVPRVAATKRPLPAPPKEQPGPRPGTPVRWTLAKGMFAEQFPGYFRAVVTGPADAWDAVEAALKAITP